MINANSYSVTQIKDTNVYLVKSALRQSGSGTKQSIAKQTGLSISTCNNILQALLESGEVSLADPASYRAVGRPAFMYIFNKDHKYVCCLHASWEHSINSTFFQYSIRNLSGDVIEEQEVNCPNLSYEEIENLLQKLVIRYPKIDTICFGTSGYYDNTKWSSRLVSAMLNGKDIQKDLAAHLNRTVIVENDMNAIAYGIFHTLPEKQMNVHSMVAIAFFKKRGTGAGIIYHQKILHGYQNFAGEIGYQNFDGKYMEELISEDENTIVAYASKAIENFVTIINPAVCFMIGDYMSEEIVEKIRNYNYGRIPENVMPKILYLRHIHAYFTEGLYWIGLNSVLNAPDF